MIPSDQCDRDAEEPGTARESIFVVVLVAEHVIDTTDPGNDARPRKCAHPDPPYADSTVLGGVRLQSHCTQLITATCAEQVEPDCDCNHDCDKQRQVRGGAVEVGVNVGETR